jgi:RNA polymerase sigma factor (sigma-70 family)
MRHDVPSELSALLDSTEGRARDDAWAAFVQRHSRLLLHAARSYGGDRDAIMDRYAYVLERLRADDFRRLRTWERDRRSKLTTWLMVVAQRMSLDLHRQRYGRPRGDGDEAANVRAARRRLVDLLAERLDDDQTPGESTVLEEPDAAIRGAELAEILGDAVAELPGSARLLLTLRFRDCLSGAEIARVLSFPSPFHVYRELDRVLSHLRHSLRRRGVEDPAP